MQAKSLSKHALIYQAFGKDATSEQKMLSREHLLEIINAKEKPYISSITSRYGDVENVKADVKTLNEILGRQGSNLLIDVIADNLGECALKFKFTQDEIKIVKDSTIEELKNAIEERT